jgi:hypothetical protein
MARFQTFAFLGCYAAYISSCRRFGTTYRFHLQGSSLEDGTDRLSQHVVTVRLSLNFTSIIGCLGHTLDRKDRVSAETNVTILHSS